MTITTDEKIKILEIAGNLKKSKAGILEDYEFLVDLVVNYNPENKIKVYHKLDKKEMVINSFIFNPEIHEPVIDDYQDKNGNTPIK